MEFVVNHLCRPSKTRCYPFTLFAVAVAAVVGSGSGCGDAPGTSSSADGDTGITWSPTVTEQHIAVDDVAGTWYSVFMGTASNYFRWMYLEPPSRAVWLEENDYMGPGREEQDRFEGSFTLEPDGTVEITWDNEDAAVSRSTFSVIDADALNRLGFTEFDGDSRFWSTRGYVAQDRERSHFRREQSQTFRDSSEVMRRSGLVAELHFTPPMTTMVAGGPCTMAVRLQTDTWDDELGSWSSGEERLEVDCVLTEMPAGLRSIRALGPGYEGSLGEVQSTWYLALRDGGIDDRHVAHDVVSRLRYAFEPLLYVDPLRPEVLFHAQDNFGPSSLGGRTETGCGPRGSCDDDPECVVVDVSIEGCYRWFTW